MSDQIYRGKPGTADQTAPLHYLLRFAAQHALRVTSGEYLAADGTAHHPEAGHNPHSLHYCGRALDVSTHGLTDAAVEHLIALAVQAGLCVYDERERPETGVWTGPHLHLSIPPLAEWGREV